MNQPFALDTIAAGHCAAKGCIDAGNATSVLGMRRRSLGGASTVVDLSGLESADGVTLAVLVAWSAEAARSGHELRFVNIGDRLAAVAHLCDVEGFLGVGTVVATGAQRTH